MSVAGCELGDVLSFALGVEQRHRGLGEVAAVAGLQLVVRVGEHGSDESDDGCFVGLLPLPRAREVHRTERTSRYCSERTGRLRCGLRPNQSRSSR